MNNPTDTLFELLTGHWGGQTVHAGLQLGVFDVLADTPGSAGAVAEELELDPDNTYRLLRALGSLGLLQERPGRHFAITEMGAMLTSDNPQDFRSMFLLEEGFEYPTWTHLSELVRTGKEDGFAEEYGRSAYEYAEANPDYSEVFNQAMTSVSKLESAAVLEVLGSDAFAGISHLCDVGGGRGYLLSHLLEEHSDLTGEVLDLPKVVEEAGEVPEAMGVADRITFTAGNMFEAVPKADGYVMKHNLHGWSDAECLRILKNIRTVATEGTPVFSAEYVVPRSPASHFAKLYDIKIMVAAGGRQRTLDEYEELFSRAGIELAGQRKAEGQLMSVVEGRTT